MVLQEKSEHSGGLGHQSRFAVFFLRMFLSGARKPKTAHEQRGDWLPVLCSPVWVEWSSGIRCKIDQDCRASAHQYVFLPLEDLSLLIYLLSVNLYAARHAWSLRFKGFGPVDFRSR